MTATATTKEQLFGGLIAPGPGGTLAYMTLDAQYGLMDDNMAISSTTATLQTVEQVFQVYVTAPLSLPNIDILKFWEASGELMLLIANQL